MAKTIWRELMLWRQELDTLSIDQNVASPAPAGLSAATAARGAAVIAASASVALGALVRPHR